VAYQVIVDLEQTVDRCVERNGQKCNYRHLFKAGAFTYFNPDRSRAVGRNSVSEFFK
jgi:hypothetical protein